MDKIIIKISTFGGILLTYPPTPDTMRNSYTLKGKKGVELKGKKVYPFPWAKYSIHKRLCPAGKSIFNTA